MPGRDGSVRMVGFRMFVALMMAAAGGCFSNVHLVRETPDGGVVVIPNNSNQWPTYYRNRAEYLMKKKCPEGYVIDREEATEDNPAARDGRNANENFEYNGAYQRITQYRREEYHIFFHCAAPPPPTDWLPQ